MQMIWDDLKVLQGMQQRELADEHFGLSYLTEAP